MCCTAKSTATTKEEHTTLTLMPDTLKTCKMHPCPLQAFQTLGVNNPVILLDEAAGSMLRARARPGTSGSLLLHVNPSVTPCFEGLSFQGFRRRLAKRSLSNENQLLLIPPLTFTDHPQATCTKSLSPKALVPKSKC